MKIIVAQSTAGTRAEVSFYTEALCAFLEEEGHKVQQLELPSIAAPGRALTNIASFRLLGTELTADAVICLDAVAAVLRHPHKLIVMLDDAYLVANRAQLAHEPVSARRYISSILRTALAEADHIFALSRFAVEGLRALSFDHVELLYPIFALPSSIHARHQGSELLALNPLGDRQRPELLIACLAMLPEPFRARWIASEASPTRVARLRQMARDAGVEQRLAIDVRSVNAGERAYLLSQAAALVELAPESLAIGYAVHQAIQIGVPVICCADGGAVIDAVGRESPAPAQPHPTALAAAVGAACGPCDLKPARRAPRAPGGTTGWAPLLKALAG